MVRHTKLSDVVVADYTKDPIPNKDGAVRRRSNSRDRARRDSVDSVSYEKSETGDDVSIGASWQGDGVSIWVPARRCCLLRHGLAQHSSAQLVNPIQESFPITQQTCWNLCLPDKFKFTEMMLSEIWLQLVSVHLCQYEHAHNKSLCGCSHWINSWARSSVSRPTPFDQTLPASPSLQFSAKEATAGRIFYITQSLVTASVFSVELQNPTISQPTLQRSIPVSCVTRKRHPLFCISECWPQLVACLHCIEQTVVWFCYFAQRIWFHHHLADRPFNIMYKKQMQMSSNKVCTHCVKPDGDKPKSKPTAKHGLYPCHFC